MRSTRNTRGVALVYVLALLALAGVLMAMMMQGSRALQRETDKVISLAHRRNLQASAAAWARVHADVPHRATTLDTTALAIPESSATVSAAPDGDAAISVSYRCPMLRRIVHVEPDGSILAEPAESGTSGPPEQE